MDAFASQHLNLDGSGRGDLVIFQAHLEKFARQSSRVRIPEADSFDCR